MTGKAHAAEKVKAQVQKVKDKAQAIVDDIAKDKAVAMIKLEAAKPALEDAENALNTIKGRENEYIRECRTKLDVNMSIYISSSYFG